MNDYGNNIILASQAGCDLVLITEEGGDFPVGSKVFYYDDTTDVRQGFDITNSSNGSNKFENNQNIAVDWEVDLPSDFTWQYMFSESALKSLTQVNMPRQTGGAAGIFKNCKTLKKISMKISVPNPGGSYQSSCIISNICSGCSELESVEIKISGTPAIGVMAVGAFENCTSLTNLVLNISNNFLNTSICRTTDMFKGCRLNSKLLQQLLDSLPIPGSKISSADITIGYDPASVDPNVDKPEGSELTWAEAFAEKKWTVTWEAYVEPVANTPKLLKAAKQKLYKLDEIDEELLDMLGDSTVYVKGGKHYLMTSGDSVTAPGTDGALLRDTDVENVVRAGSLQEAIDLLGVTEK